MNLSTLCKIFFLHLLQHLTFCGTKEIQLECDISETHFTKNSCSFTTTTCIIEQYRDVWLDNVKLSFTNARDENFTSIVFQNSYIRMLPKEIFDQFSNLESLDMSKIGMKGIPDRTFVNAVVLMELNLANNDITRISEHTFVGATKLRSLNLANNRIVSVHDKAFRETPKLEYVDLCHNLIQIVHKDTFGSLESLRNVYLYHNSIVDVNPQSFVNSKELNTLDLNGNVLREVQLELASVRLNKLDLSNCSLDELTLKKSSNITDTVTIRYLNLFQNQLTNMSVIHVDKSVKLQNIDVSKNRLRALNIGPAFLQDVTTLKINNNQLWEITPGFLRQLAKLKSLYLENNVLRLYEKMFNSLMDLRVLSLANNHLREVDLSLFKGLNNLTQLSLEDNVIQVINYTDLMNVLPSLQSFIIDNNRFRCSFVENMVNYVRNTTEGRSIEFTITGRGKFPSCIPDEQPGESYWGWILTGVLLLLFVALIIITRNQLVERFNEVRRRLTSYRNMREQDHSSGSGPLNTERDDD